MAFVAWSTVVAGTVATASWANQNIRDNLNAWFPNAATAGTALTTYTPVLTQSGTVTKTVDYAKYMQVGKLVTVKVKVTCTGAGTANNRITLSLPVTGIINTALTGDAGYISAAGVSYPGLTYIASTTTMAMLDSTQATAASMGQTGATWGIALANTHIVVMSLTYEAA